ncbi:cytochrome bd oxidase small subunit CydS [Cytobacillus depressus]
MEHFLMFYAPFIVVVLSIVVAFWAGLKDDAVSGEQKQ